MVLLKCDLCGATADCVQKQIEGREYDLCSACWSALEEKLRGKGRPAKPPEEKERIVLVPPAPRPETEEHQPAPEGPPTIWGDAAPFH